MTTPIVLPLARCAFYDNALNALFVMELTAEAAVATDLLRVWLWQFLDLASSIGDSTLAWK